ncbi:MAG: sulfatase-like hydrolase/transferase [Planctomycetaceae bacterium]|nr:sulfatase-like hydrolase/transferase [Planctomycetaceae bacterium]
MLDSENTHDSLQSLNVSKIEWTRIGIASFPLLVVLLCSSSPAADTKDQRGRPNFIFVLGEAQGWASMSVETDAGNLQSKSDFFETPTLERLADDGMRFASFYAPSPRCTPSRVAYVTGKSPAQLHMTFTSNRGSPGRKVLEPIPSLEMPLKEITVAEVLKPAGYVSAHFGKWHMGRTNPSKHGFIESDGATSNGGPDNSRNPNPKQAYAITQRGIDFMSRQVKAGKPFYLQISHYGGRSAADALRSTYDAVLARGGRDERRAGAAAVVLDMDTMIRMLLAKVDQLGIADNTYFIYTADHGTPGRNGPLQGGKGGLWEGGIRIPLIIRGPGIAAGICSRVRVTGVDLFPTIAELAGVSKSVSKDVEGGSLVPVLMNRGQGDVKRSREELVFHFPHYDKDSLGPASALLLGNYKLVRPYETDARLLFDLSNDIGERRNLAAAMPDKVKEFDTRLTKYLASVNAQMPTRNGNAAPKDREANQPDQAQGQRGQGGRGKNGRGKGGAGVIFRLLDTDRDGQLSSKEIDNAVITLKKLDKNKDGILSAEELRIQGDRREDDARRKGEGGNRNQSDQDGGRRQRRPNG